jgi:hypothetical protein
MRLSLSFLRAPGPFLRAPVPTAGSRPPSWSSRYCHARKRASSPATGRRLPTYIGPTQAQVREGRRKIITHRNAKVEEVTERIPIQMAVYPKPSDSAI